MSRNLMDKVREYERREALEAIEEILESQKQIRDGEIPDILLEGDEQ